PHSPAFVLRRNEELRGLGDLARLQTPRAHIGAEGSAVLLDPHLLQVRVEAPLGRNHRVAAGVAERRSLAAAMAYLGHEDAGWYRLALLAALPRPGPIGTDLALEQGHAGNRERSIAALIALVAAGAGQRLFHGVAGDHAEGAGDAGL